MSKYNPLWEYIYEKNKDVYRLTFKDMKEILGFEIDHSFLTYKKELKKYGYEIEKTSMKNKEIIVTRLNRG